MTEESHLDRDRRHLWHPYTRHSAVSQGLPLIVRGEGPYLYDQEGRRYLDAISSWWACHLGHGHPEIVEAIRQQASVLQHSILGNLSHPTAVELARELAALMPDDRRHVHFAGDGASAVEAALKIALQYWHNRGQTQRTQFASLRMAYHGDTLAALSLGYLEAFHRPFEALRFPCYQISVPPYDTGADRAIEEAASLFERHGRRLAALVVEPMCQGAAGMRVYAAAYLAALGALCRQHDTLLIADEIAMGFGRTGRMFAYEHAGLDPDIVCVGKGLSAGYLPISAAIVKDRIYETFADEPADHTFYHGHTFAGNPMASAAALAAIKIYTRDHLPERAARLGAMLHERLRPLSSRFGVQDVRGLGLLCAIELGGRAGAVARAQRIQARLLAEGILLRPLEQVVYLIPPLTIGEEVLAHLAEKVARQIEETA